MKTKIFFFLLLVLPVLAFGQSGKFEITEKIINIEVQRIKKDYGTYARFITHHQEDMSECIPTRPDCDLYRTQKLSYKEYLLDSLTSVIPDSILLKAYKYNLIKEDYVYKKDLLETSLISFVCEVLIFKNTSIVFLDNIIVLKNNYVPKNRISLLFFGFIFVLSILFIKYKLHKQDKTKGPGVFALCNFFTFLIIVSVIINMIDLMLNYDIIDLMYVICSALFVIVNFVSFVLFLDFSKSEEKNLSILILNLCFLLFAIIFLYKIELSKFMYLISFLALIYVVLEIIFKNSNIDKKMQST